MSANQDTAASLPDISENLDTAPAVERAARAWLDAALRPLEIIAAMLMVVIVGLLLSGVTFRYVLQQPLVWVDEVASIAFVWVAMIGSALAMHRNEHLRLTLFVNMVPERPREYVRAFATVAVVAFLAALVKPAFEYVTEEWVIRTPALDLPNSYRVGAMLFGILAMLAIVSTYALRTLKPSALLSAVIGVGLIGACCGYLAPVLAQSTGLAMLIFLVGLVAACLVAGVPIAFCFGLGTLCFLAFASNAPLMVVVSRMDEGMSSIILISVPIFVLLGCVLDATGMGKAIVDFLASLIGHVRAGMSYVLLGSLFIVSGISGSKVSDMATVAPALFPEMKRRGHKPPEMIALLATGAAMADTVPPSIVLIVLGSVAGVSIAGLFQSGFVVAMVLLLSLLVLARWKARHEDMSGARRPRLSTVGKLVLIAAPALALPFLIRSAVGGGVATATEVSTLAVLYAMIIGQLLYGGIGLRKLYGMLVETAALSGSVLLILGTAAGMAWAITQSGVVQKLSQFLMTMPGGAAAFLAVTIVVFLILGCLLEGLPAVLLLAPIMFPIARKLGIHDIHYSMVVVCAMNVGLMAPPIGVGFYIACRIGGASPDEVTRAIWPYLAALVVGVIVIAAIPAISTVAL
ncbi:MAG: TRAP transporter large permease subunit [Burkholderiales bacterium]